VRVHGLACRRLSIAEMLRLGRTLARERSRAGCAAGARSGAWAFVALSFLTAASPIVTSTLDASLDTGSLAGVTFPVSFSYDAGQVQPVGDSFIILISFDFVLLGVPFNRSEIFQGGQVIFRDGHLVNVTAYGRCRRQYRTGWRPSLPAPCGPGQERWSWSTDTRHSSLGNPVLRVAA
jgi:hypothetical protein